MVLEGLVAGLLNRFLGMYVRNFDPKHLNVGIWSGDVELRDLELRREALDALHLPINVVEGHLGRLKMIIPFSNLRGKPVQIFIEDVFLLAAPKEDAEYDEAEEERRRQALKMEKLDSAELLKERSGEGLSKEEQQKNQSFASSLTTKIVDNLQVTIQNIHIRYEDSISAPGHPFALGFTLEKFSATSTDGAWNPTFIQTSTGVAHKLATLDALALYWNTDATLFGTGQGAKVGAEAQGLDEKDVMKRFRDLIVKTEDSAPGSHQFVLKPVSGQAKIEMDKSGDVNKPGLKAGLLFDEIAFVLDEDQYRDALMMVDLFHYFIRHQEYKKYQPKGVTPKEDPRAWLRFAGDAVLRKIHERNRQWSWDYMRERRDDRIKYIELFKKKKKEQTMTPTEKEDLSKLEQKLTYEDLRFWRSLARNQLRKENALVKKTTGEGQKQGWGAWIWGSAKEEQKEENTVMTDEQRKELYEAIEWDEKNALAADVSVPRESVKMQIEASLKTGSFTLKRDPHGGAKEVLSLLFDSFAASMLQRPDSLLASLRLGGLRVYDGTTDGSLFPQIVAVKDSSTAHGDNQLEEISDEETAENEDGTTPKGVEDPFFELHFENNPLDDRADTAVTVKMKSMEIIYNPNFVVQTAKFFKPPERHMESIGALMETAGATVEGIRQQTRAGLEFALEEHKTIDANLDIQAPLIIVPASIVEKSATCLILDAGHVSLKSELVDKATLRDIQSKQKQQYSEEDLKQLEAVMYDKFLVKLHSTQVLIGPSIEETRAQLQEKNDERNLHIIDRINMDFLVETSILPKAPNLTKFRVSGHLPLLHASVSDVKYKKLMKLIDVAIPKFDDGYVAPAEARPSTSQSKTVGEKHRLLDQQGRARSTSFEFSKLQRDLIVDEEASEDGDEDQFEEASSGKTNDDQRLHQKNFEFRFTVDRLQGSLYKASPDGTKPDQLLVDVVADHFELDFYQRPFDMVAEVLLKSLVVEDCIEENPEAAFKNIISSKDFKADGEKDLFHVKFVKVNKDSPEFMTTYDGFETNLDVSISTINLVVTRKTLLTLLDFVLMTFSNPDASASQARSIEDNDGKNERQDADPTSSEQKPPGAGKIRIKVNLKSIVLILNNDGIKLATLSLNSADVGIFLSGKTMRINTRLGNLSLLDNINEGVSERSPLRQLITIEGNNLADFRYETFDADLESSYPGYDSEVFLRSGSIKINFVEEPFRKIIDFLVKFGKMQAIFNAARQAALNQANQIQEKADKMHFDIIVKTPIVVFPRMTALEKPKRDTITAYLGEIYANNKFVPLDDSQNADVANKLSAGIRNIRLTSLLHFEDEEAEELDLIDKVDLSFLITYLEHKNGSKRPDLEVQGFMSNFNLRLTQFQLRFLFELSKTVPAAFATDPEENEEQALQELPRSTVKHAKSLQDEGNDKKEEVPADLGPELDVHSETWTKLDLVFTVEAIGLELVKAKEASALKDIDSASLSKFSLNETSIKLRMVSDGSLESELLIRSFTIKDSRRRDTNKFRKIMTCRNQDVQQFMASLTMSGGEERNMIAILTIDSPRVIFALDYVFAIQSFVSVALTQDGPMGIEVSSEESSEKASDSTGSVRSQDDGKLASTHTNSTAQAPQSENISEKQQSTSMSFRVNIVEAQVILIANPTIGSSEAIVLGTKQIVLSQQHALTLQVSKVGMFLCRMDQFDTTRLRILDDFSLHMSMDTRAQDPQSISTNIQIDVEPMILRLSLRDILLALQIVNKASELSAKDDIEPSDREPKKLKDVKSSSDATKRRSITGGRTSTMANKTTKSETQAKRPRAGSSETRVAPVTKREEMTAQFEGMRVVLIGDLHELPLLDLSVQRFDVDVRDWSGELSGHTSIDTFINIYNFSKSSWEPLIEPWQLGFHISKEKAPDRMSVELSSRKALELTVTSATIALASKSAQFLTQDEDVLSRPRGADAPYRIRNYTGFDLNVWADAQDDDSQAAAKMSDGEETPWRFEGREKMRDSLSPEGGQGLVGLRLEGSGFESVNRIPVNREGETMYNLRPKKDKIVHRLLVEVRLGEDNVKYITFRSPLLVENKTQIPVEMGVFDSDEGHLLKIEKIKPGEARPAPVGAVYMHSLLIRPDQGFGYAWCRERLYWRELLKRPIRTVVCKGEGGDKTPPFFFQMKANFDKNDPLTSVYPYMRLCLSAPVELHNLLPYDFKYRIYDKNTKKDWTNFLRKGGISPVHVVELSHLLLMSIDMQDTVYKQSEFAIINSNNQEEFDRETTLVAKDAQGLTLNLKLHYFNIPDSGGAFRVSVYSPYLILNKTGLEIDIRSKTFLQQSKAAAGQGVRTNAGTETDRKALPYMFSYATDDRHNRSILKVGDSNWSKPQSFEAIGSDVDVVLPSSNKRKEIHIGISVDAGEGKYKLTKIVNLAPRFIIKNRLSEEINVREPGSSTVMTLKANNLFPLHFLHQGVTKQLSLSFPGLDNQWSSPFNIADLGSVHVKLARAGAGQRQKLIKVEILLEQATIFLHISFEKDKNWPYSIRNESDTEFTFFQANPNIDEDEVDNNSGWRPIRYRLPPRAIMPYAWDYPAAKAKELIINGNGKERHVKLAEIGNLIPMKIPVSKQSKQQKIIDINVVAQGPTQTLVLSNYKPSKSLYKQKSHTSSQTSLATGFEVKDLNTDVTFKVQLNFAGIGVSLINSHLRELAYITFRDIDIKYSDSPLFQNVSSTIKWIQIDNQLYGGIFPLILYPSVVPKIGKEMEAHPIFSAAVTKVKDESYGVLYIKYATVLLQQMTLEIDEDFVFALLDFLKLPGSTWSEENEGKLCDENLDIPEPKSDQQGQDVYFELLHIQPAQLDLSFVRTERVNVEDKTTSRNPLTFFLNVLTMAIGNVNDAPVRLNALMLENARVSIPLLSRHVQSHYSQEFLYQVHKILGSADFLGNPVGLFNNLSSGVVDIFYEPYQGLVMSDRPQELGIGIAKGATSFVKKSVFGVTDSMSKWTGSMSKGLAAASMDKQFQDRRRMTKSRNRPKHALYGVTSGANSLVTSVASGVGGLARAPMEGAEREGVSGFFKGVGKGMLGLPTKTAVGVFDLASNVTEGIRNTTTVFDAEGLDRVRLPRFIGTDDIVRPYSQREALGQFWLKQLDSGKYFDEHYIAHLELPREDVVVMLTYNRIMLVKAKKLSGEWDVPLKDIQTISKERTGLSVTLKGGTNGPYIPVQEESSRNFLYKQIGIAVNAFNDKYRAREQ
ncbi:MAG: hypothetical protein M1833_004553 [Piccolia ochrophora]|nr:MAG: hypothetical protein M1833_004553 [Piccolia ochrophora]